MKEKIRWIFILLAYPFLTLFKSFSMIIYTIIDRTKDVFMAIAQVFLTVYFRAAHLEDVMLKMIDVYDSKNKE